MIPFRRWFISLLLILFSGLAAPMAGAAIIDVPCGDTTDLIAAINTANANSGPDTINLATGCTLTTYRFSAKLCELSLSELGRGGWDQ